jgi:hypothetical protein
MNIAFVDIDGVLAVASQEHDEYGQLFHPHFVNNLKRIIDETQAKIVISSSWRKSSLKIMQEMWEYRNLPGEVIDTTPSLYIFKGTNNIQFWNNKLSAKQTPRIKGYSVPRGCEVDYWIQNESQAFGTIKNYVILDDDTDFLMKQFNNYVQCSNVSEHPDNVHGYGLTEINTIKAIRILNRPTTNN